MSSFLTPYSIVEVNSTFTNIKRDWFIQLIWFTFLLGITAAVALLMLYRGPDESFLAWIIYFVGIALILYKPRYGIYMILGLGLAGDGVLSPWFPFSKNFSSRESILFLHDALIFNPLETYITITLISWLIRTTSTRKLHIFRSSLLLPALSFLMFVLFGLWYGIRTGGDLNIALWEARPLFYLAIMLFLVSNLLNKREHLIYLLWSAMVGVLFEAILGNWYFFVKLHRNLAGVNAITDHPAAIHMNTLLMFFLASWLYKVSNKQRLALSMMVLVGLVPYLANQRRAAYITLGLALIVMAVLLFKENRIAFLVIFPVVAIVIAAYLGAFWNQDGGLAAPAQAIKSVIAPEQASVSDQYSNAYRDLENINLHFTLRQKPLTGIGFGQKFYVVVALPNISWFQWWQYFPHNSIIWIWLKTGVAGFFTMLYLFGLSIMTGARALWRMPRNELSAIALTGVLYLIMHIVFAYVDIGWDTQSGIYLGAMMGLIGSLENIVSQPVPTPAKRWRWQRDPQPPPGMLPLPEK